MIAHGTLLGDRLAHRLAEQLANAAAVGQARQHVDIGEVGQPLLRLAHFGDVAADAAIAFEAARGVDDRIAGDRDPARAARGLQFHLERVERLLAEQDAAKFGMAAKQGGERMAEDRRRRAAEQRRSCAS